MQKKIIALAIAAMVSAPAFADNSNITIYGIADLSYDFINTGTTAAGVAGVSKRNVSSNVSRLGLKGVEDLGDGLAAVWQIEQQINMDNTGGTFATRNTFLGLKSNSMGTVLLGRHDTPYKISTRKLDVFGDSIADNRGLMGGVTGTSAAAAFDGRQPDVIAYISPALNGFTGAVAYVNLTEANTTAAAAKASAVTMTGMYDAGPFYGALGYEEHKLDTVQVGGKESAWKLGLGYTMDAFTLGFAYEKTSDNLTPVTYANLFGHNAYYLSGKYNIGNDAVKLAYGKAGQLGATANTGANQFSLGYDHGLSKRTKLYAIYSRISNQSGVNYGFSQTTAVTINGAGASPSVVSLGMKHTF
ncbi:MAG: porin [Nitrosomonadales bacterium]|nr:porin [Nitrosomonadales bacterium]